MKKTCRRRSKRTWTSIELKHKLPGILNLFLELEEKTMGTEYLVALLKYLGKNARYLTREELYQSVTQTFEKGGDVMASIADEYIAEGEKKWKTEEKWEVIKKSLRLGLPIDTIEQITGIPADKINSLKEKSASN